MSHKKENIKKATAKLLLAGVLSFGAITITAPAMAQAPTPPQGPPGPPPSPGEILGKAGEGLKKINPFKKHTKSKVDNKVDALQPGDTPPAPPNPLDLFKKKKKGGSILPPPPKAPGA